MMAVIVMPLHCAEALQTFLDGFVIAADPTDFDPAMQRELAEAIQQFSRGVADARSPNGRTRLIDSLCDCDPSNCEGHGDGDVSDA